MKHLIYSTVLLAALMGGACDKNDNDNKPGTPTTPVDPPAPEEQAISFNPGIKALTRSPQLEEDGSGSFSTGDTFTLYAHDNAEDFATFDYTIGTTELLWKNLTVATENGTVHFEACYPKHALTNGTFDFKVTQDEAGDLLWATAPDVKIGTTEPIALNFSHAMHRLVVNYQIDDPSIEASQIETRCTAYGSCRVDLSIQKIFQLPEAGKETYTANGSQVKFMLPPQMPSDVTLEIRIGNLTQSWNLADTNFNLLELASGMEGTVNLKVQDGEITLSGMTIGGWGDQGSIDDEIIL